MSGRNLKRSLSLEGHRTSVALEPEFWAELDDWARAERITVADLVARIDRARPEGDAGLASALRVAALNRARRTAEVHAHGSGSGRNDDR